MRSARRWLAVFMLLILTPGSEGGSAWADDAPTQPGRISQLIGNLTSEHEAVRDASSAELEAIGPAVLDPLRDAAGDRRDAGRARAAQQLLDVWERHTHKFVDALGEPIVGADVFVHLPDEPDPIQLQTNLLGNLVFAPPREAGRRFYLWEFEVRHAAYNTVVCRSDARPRDSRTITLPVVPQTSPAVERSARGRVLDPDGNPVPGVRVTCLHVHTPGYEILQGPRTTKAVVTDERGEFAVYVQPNDYEKHAENDSRVLADSRYFLSLIPPPNDELWRWTGTVVNDQPVTITLDRPYLSRRFQIESSDGEPIQGREKNDRLHLRWQPAEDGSPYISLAWERLFMPSKLMPGFYRLTYNGVEYQPIVLDSESPETLLFRLPPVTVFTGRVVDGVTGEPIEGAIVLGTTSEAMYRANLAWLTDDQWDALHTMPDDFTVDHPALAPIRRGFGLSQAARTGADGTYVLRQPTDGTFGRIIVCDRNKLPVWQRSLSSFEPDDEHHVALDPMPLFPAATLRVMPEHEGLLGVLYHWQSNDNDSPAWLGAMHEAVASNNRGYHHGGWLALNIEQPIYVPAGVELQLTFRTPYAPEWSNHELPDPIRIEPGEEQALFNTIVFDPCRQLAIRVVDEAGQPLERIPVRTQYRLSRGWGGRHFTDADGFTYIYVEPEGVGRFAVNIDPLVSVDFDEAADAKDHVYEMTLSAEQVQGIDHRRP